MAGEIAAGSRSPRLLGMPRLAGAVFRWVSARDYLAVYLSALIFFPLLLMTVDRSWVWATPNPFVDPNVYTGYFLHFSDYLQEYPSAYYSSRIPWISFGALAHWAFSADLANYVLRLTLIYASCFSIFGTIRLFGGSNLSAFLSAVLLASHTYFLKIVGWDYIDGMSVALTLVAAVVLTAAARGQRFYTVLLFGAGFVQAWMVAENLLLAALVPLQIAGFLYLNHQWAGNRLVLGALAWASGLAAGTAALAAISAVAGGPLLFYEAQLNAGGTITGERLLSHPLALEWLTSAAWLVVPAISLCVGLASVPLLWRAGRGGGNALFSAQAVSVVQLVTAIAGFAGSQIIGLYFLRSPHHASLLLPFTFLALGSVLIGVAGAKGPRALAIAFLAVLVLTLPFMVDQLRPFDECRPECDLVSPVALLAVGTIAALVVAVVLRNLPVLIVGLTVFGLVNVAIADTRVVRFDRSEDLQARSTKTFEAERVVHELAPDLQTRLWYDARERNGDIFQSIASMRLWAYNLVSNRFPSLSFPLREAGRNPESVVETGEHLLILSSDPSALAQADAALSRFELAASPAQTVELNGPTGSFRIYLVQAVPLRAGDILALDLAALPVRKATGSVEQRVEGLVVKTEARRYAYAALFGLPPDVLSLDGPAYIQVTLEVARGKVGIGVLTADEKAFVARTPASVAAGRHDVFLEVPDPSALGDLVIQTWNKAAAAEVTIISIEVVQRALN